MKLVTSKQSPSVVSEEFNEFSDRLQAIRRQSRIVPEAVVERLEQQIGTLLPALALCVGALGGKLHVAATFDETSATLWGDKSWVPRLDEDFVDVSDSLDGQLALPGVLGGDPKPPRRDIVFSVRPTHAEKILEGTKTVELRRRFTDEIGPGSLAIIYETSPTRALTGFATIENVQRLPLGDLWKRHRVAACLPKGDFEAYFSGLQSGYAIMLSSAKPFARPVRLPELRKRFGFEPPQSFQYASPRMRGLVEHECSVQITY